MRFDLERKIDEIFDLYLTFENIWIYIRGSSPHLTYSSTVALASSSTRPHSLCGSKMEEGLCVNSSLVKCTDRTDKREFSIPDAAEYEKYNLGISFIINSVL